MGDMGTGAKADADTDTDTDTKERLAQMKREKGDQSTTHIGLLSPGARRGQSNSASPQSSS